MKRVIVPQTDIDNIDISNKKLYEIIDKIKDKEVKEALLFIIPLEVTNNLWHITHRKYKETLRSKIRNMFKKNTL